jgi:hypothetical protein
MLAKFDLPDVISVITEAQQSSAAYKAMNEVAGIGELVCNSGEASDREFGLLTFASAATELDMKLLEQVREEICVGLETLDSGQPESAKAPTVSPHH